MDTVQKPTPLSDDENALLSAALAGDSKKVRSLLAKGVAVDGRDGERSPLGLERNVTPLICAAAKGHLDAVRALLDAGANVSAATDANKQDGGGGSQALHHALLNKHVAVAELLLDNGADANAIGR